MLSAAQLSEFVANDIVPKTRMVARRIILFAACAIAIVVDASAAAVKTIPFRWTPGQIEIEVSVNGGPPLWFIVDTGAEFSILSDTLAKRLDLRTRRRGIRDFASGVTLTFGGVELPRRDVMIMSFETFRARKRPIEGIIGHDFFERYVVTIDYAGKTLTAIAPGGFHAPDGAESIPLRFAGNLAVVPVTLELADGKRATANVIVDTGASQALVLRHPFAQKHDLLRQSTSSSMAGSLESVSVSFAHVPAKRLSLGRWSFDNPPIRAYRTATGAGGYTATDGALGNEILRRFRVTLDYPRKRMLLEPN